MQGRVILAATTLIQEFNEYVFEHPEILQKIPDGAVVVLQVADDPKYNAWSRAVAEANREPGRSLVFAHIEARTRIITAIGRCP